MTCREAQKRLVDWFDRGPERAPEVEAHVAACANCARAYADMQAAAGLIEPRIRVQASPDFKERVMKRLTETEVPRSRWRFVPRLALAGAAAMLAIVLFAPHGQSPAVSLLAQ